MRWFDRGLLLTLLSAIVFSHPWNGRIYKEGDFKVVENYGPGIWGRGIEQRIRMKETLSIGKEDGEDYEIFSSELFLSVGPKGELVVLDQRELKLRKFSPQGKFLWQAGKRGEGPGEFKYPHSVAISPQEEIWVPDYGKIIHVFSPDGKFKENLKLDVEVGQVFFLKNGKVLAALFSSGRSGLKAALFDRSLRKTLDFPFRYTFGPKLPWGSSFQRNSITASSGRIIFALPDKYEIVVFTEDSSPVLKIKRKVNFKPTQIKLVGGGIRITTGDQIGPCFFIKSGYYVVQFRKLKGEGKNSHYQNFLDFYTAEGKLLGSYPLPEATVLKWADEQANLYFFQKEPFPRIFRASFWVK